MAAYSKTIICLANSWKLGGRCIAGKVVNPPAFGEWIRPIGTANHGALSFQDRNYQGGGDPAPLDIIEIKMSGTSPHPYQVENHSIDVNWYWRLIRQAPPAALHKALDPAQPHLWGLYDSSGSGINDRVNETAAPAFGYSLKLIQVVDFALRVSVENPHFSDKRTVRGSFSYSGNGYALTVTDPKTTATYLAQPNGNYYVGQAILCVSLSELFNGYAYKLIAGVF